MPRSIPPAPTHKNQRRCVTCRAMADKSDLWRIVRTFPDRTISLSVGMGRSVYLCKTETCLKNAEKKDRLSRSLRAPVPPEIYQQLYQKLHESLTDDTTRHSPENATIGQGIL